METLPAASVPVRATYRKGMILGVRAPCVALHSCTKTKLQVDTEGSASSDMDDSFGADPVSAVAVSCGSLC